jgi:hypothetical protein
MKAFTFENKPQLLVFTARLATTDQQLPTFASFKRKKELAVRYRQIATIKKHEQLRSIPVFTTL